MYARANHARRAVEHQLTIATIGRLGAAAMQECRQATHAIAALLHLAAVGIEDAVVDLGAGAARRLDHQRLVEADTGVARGERAPLGGGRQPSVARRIENDEIVAEAVHFGELELHGRKNTLRFTGMRPVPWIVAALVLFLAWRLYSQRDMDHAPGVRAAADPDQQEIAGAAGIEHGTFVLRPRAEFSATVRILAREDYSAGELATLVPTDFAVGWGPMSDSAVLDDIEISQGNRFYYWRTTSWPLSRGEIERHSANWHVIAGSEAVRAILGRLRTGSIVELRGHLVDIEGREGAMKTSLSRRDTGAGACEILLADSARELRPSS